jgi:starch synthase
LKTAVSYADCVTLPATHKHLKNITKPGNDFEQIIGLSKTLYDIPFGGDHNSWNPVNNNSLYKSYSVEKFDRKQTNKEGFLEDKRTNFIPEKLTLGILAENFELQQKAITQFLKAIRNVPLQIFLLANENPTSFAAVKTLISKNEHHIVFCMQDHDDQFRHNFFAVCDLFYIPPTEEFSDLYYLNGIHYGAVPLISKDSPVAHVFEPIKEKHFAGEAFVFGEESDLEKKLEAATQMFAEREKWDGISKKLMKKDLSWNIYTPHVIRIYERALSKVRQ